MVKPCRGREFFRVRVMALKRGSGGRRVAGEKLQAEAEAEAEAEGKRNEFVWN